jgi:hypothetical protein
MIIQCGKCGVPAIGTLKGKVFLVDFCKEHEPLVTELYAKFPQNFDLIYADEGDANERRDKDTSEQVPAA